MDLKSQAVGTSAPLHILDASDEPLYANGENGEKDLTKPCIITVYGPGSRQYASASARRNNRNFERLRAQRKANQSAEEQRKEQAEFLAECTAGAQNLQYGGKEPKDRDDFVAMYSDTEIGFIAEQVAKFAAEWGNFSKKSVKS